MPASFFTIFTTATQIWMDQVKVIRGNAIADVVSQQLLVNLTNV